MHPNPYDHSSLAAIARTGDRVMVLTMLCSTAAALAIASYFGSLTLAVEVSAALLLAGMLAYAVARGTLLSQCVLTACNVALVALHIQLGRGTIEFHFGVFVLLGLLLVYRDWKPVLLAATMFAVHHVLFDRLQAMDLGVYCTPQANLLKTLMHAAYVVAQTSVEVFLAVVLHRATVQAGELSNIARTVDRDALICLDVSAIETTTPTSDIMKAFILKMGAAMTEVNAAAASVEQSAAEIAKGNLDLSQRTEEQASNLQQTAASMEELTGTVRSTADTAVTASRIAESAGRAAVGGGAAVGRVVATMQDISNSSKKITDIIGVIDGISFQTNILALNAAVEAARAGEQGRGFAVVASEVRSLAQRSAEAAKEIKALIGASVERVALGTQLVHDAGSGMRDIVAQAARVSELIGAISSAAGEQTAGISQVGDAVSQLDAVTQQNAALVEQGAAAADSLKHQAARLNAVVRRFTLAPHVERA